jgi:hypothetical protein
MLPPRGLEWVGSVQWTQDGWRVSITEALEKYGYHNGSQRYVRPGGQTPSVTVKDGRSFHWSTDDPLCDKYWHRSFDLFCHYEHGSECLRR